MRVFVLVRVPSGGAAYEIGPAHCPHAKPTPALTPPRPRAHARASRQTRLVEPEFGRLTAFDPRLPHGVAPVHGVHDPREARVVLHAWFSEPEPFFEGGLPKGDASDALQDLMDGLLPRLVQAPEATGGVVVRFTIAGADGGVHGLELLTDTLVPRPDSGPPEAVRGVVLDIIFETLAEHCFPACESGEDTRVTLPLLF